MKASSDGAPRVVLVHDWLTGMRGGEKCLEVLCRRWPLAELFTLLHRRGSVSAAIERLRPRTSFLNLLPENHRYYRYLLPLMPAAVRSWRLPPCELVVSFSHCVAKAIHFSRRGAIPHVCYCFTPMRYAWHMQGAYFGADRVRGVKARVLERFLSWLREWDRRTADGVTHFLAISETVQRRIRECYGRDSAVIYPPVDTDFYHPAALAREDFYLAVSAFAPYKRLDLAIQACNALRRPLLLIGSGQDEARLRALAGPTIHFLGWQPDAVIRDHLRRCRALLFPGEEDFGIVPVEAQACGAPVIAFGQGGATETVVPPSDSGWWMVDSGRKKHYPPSTIHHPLSKEPTGLWFPEQTVESLAETIAFFETRRNMFSPTAARRHALHFNAARFADELFAYLDNVLRPTADLLRRAA
ncbi:MAG TPA: glycosyltransferase [Gemmataceae bacterium]|jgi:glycosyltransferase involved in cell wall biosynthesis